MNPDQIRAALRALLDRRAEQERTITETREAVGTGSPSTEQATALRAARDAIVSIDAEIDQHQAALREALDEQTRQANAAALRAELGQETRTGGARVTSEQRTYSRERNVRGETSFFVDAFRATQLGDVNATERLRRHAQEMAVERELPNDRGADGDQQYRAVSTSSFGGLVIPQYLVSLAARVIRNGRPFANTLMRLPLPEQGMSFVIPRGTTGAAAASQATENSALQNTDEVWGNLTVPVATIGGQQDVSRQSLERGTPGIDELVYLDLAGAYHAELDRQAINGTGASGQLLGALQTAGIQAASAFGAAVSAQNLNLKVAGSIAAVAGAGVGLDPEYIYMHPRRWGYLTGLSDSSGRPLVTPAGGGGQNVLAANIMPGGYSGGDDPNDYRAVRVVGSMQGLPVVTDANIPTNVGTNLEDVIMALDSDNMLLWEDGDGMPRQLRFEQTLGQNLTVKLIAYGYAAFTAGRYPQAVAKIGGVDATAGQGLIAPTF